MYVRYYFSRTQGRKQTFYDGSPGAPVGICHIPMNEPFCSRTREVSKSSGIAIPRDRETETQREREDSVWHLVLLSWASGHCSNYETMGNMHKVHESLGWSAKLVKMEVCVWLVDAHDGIPVTWVQLPVLPRPHLCRFMGAHLTYMCAACTSITVQKAPCPPFIKRGLMACD